MPVSRFVALGDSMTEGLNDGDDDSGYRGWADRLALHLAAANPDLLYANLAVRGLRASQIRATQLTHAIELRPDLVTVVAGMNDLIRARFDPDAVGQEIEAMFVALRATGAHVVTLLLPDLSRLIPMARPLRGRINGFNERIAAAAARHGVTVVDGAAHPFMYDAQTWSPDRLHASSIGHRRIAGAVADALGLAHDGDEPPVTIGPVGHISLLDRLGIEVRWVVSFFGPWLRRRITGRSSGDGRVAKHAGLVPVRVQPG